jgi:hypothetical protein
MAIGSYEVSNVPANFRKQHQYNKYGKSWIWANKDVVGIEVAEGRGRARSIFESIVFNLGPNTGQYASSV